MLGCIVHYMLQDPDPKYHILYKHVFILSQWFLLYIKLQYYTSLPFFSSHTYLLFHFGVKNMSIWHN